MKRPKRKGLRLHLYVPKAVRDGLYRAAGKNRRSVTAEAVLALERHLRAQGPPATVQ